MKAKSKKAKAPRKNKVYVWWYRNIWKDKTKWPPVSYKEFEKYIIKVIISLGEM